MKLFWKCKCHSENSFSSWSPTRIDFAKNEGETKSLTCKCGRTTVVEVDELYAKKSETIQIIALLILIAGLILAVYLTLSLLKGFSLVVIAGVFTAPIGAYILFIRQDKARVNSFNQLNFKNR